MTERIDILSPTTIGEQKIDAALDPASTTLAARPITVNFDYSRADDNGGTVLPISVTVVPISDPEKADHQRVLFRSARPESFSFTVANAGAYLVVIKESAHNRWVGLLRVQVSGDEFAAVQISERF